MTARSCIVAATLALGTAAAPAGAATITRDGAGALVYTAAAGATNSMTVQQSDVLTFYTAGGDTIVAIPDGCVRNANWPDEVVDCALPSAARVELGDGDDRAALSDEVTVAVTVAGGPGKDLLTGGPRADSFDGGPGDDQLNGSAGDDVLQGGDGNDELEGKAGRDRLDGGAGEDQLHPDGYEDPSADVVDGGPGVDTVSADYSSRFSDVDPPVAITLAGGADDGRPGEGDELTSVEKVELNIAGRYVGSDGPDDIKLAQITGSATLIGGAGDDRLRGADGPDRVEGGPGDDALDAGFGDDVIIGGPGRDAISGDLAGGDCGPYWCKEPYGNDSIDAVDGEVDSIACGAGHDSVQADVADVVAPDCESVARSGGGAAQPGPVSGHPAPQRAVKLTLAGRPRLATVLQRGLTVRVSGAAAGRLVLIARRGDTVLARGTAPVGASGRASVRLRFTAKARRALRRSQRVTLAISGGGGALRVTLIR